MTDAVFAIPGRIDTPSGAYIYDRRVMALMPSFGVTASYLSLPGAFPNPSADDLAKSVELLAQTSPSAKLVIDGLALGVMPPEIMESLGSRTIALIHHPLAVEPGLSQKRRETLFDLERAVLPLAGQIIATSNQTRAQLIEDYAIAADKITVAAPGTDPAPRATGTGTPLQLLAVGAVMAHRGYGRLIEALATIAHLDWRLTIVGAEERDAETVERLRTIIAENKLQDRVTLTGIVVPATLERLYDSADIFIMPSPLRDYGMAVCEAMVRGLPILSTARGDETQQVLPDTATLKVPENDPEALQSALTRLLGDRKLRTKLADAAWDAGRTLPTWNETARRVGALIMGLKV